MAAQGFNVCMIGRSLDKMNEKMKEIVTKCPKIKTRVVVFDFSKLTQISDYRTQIAEKLKDIDIAMLYLNAGFAQIGPYADIAYSEV